jgi:DNA-binding MarR family transcriptional regulator
MKFDSIVDIYDSPGYLLRRSGQFVTTAFDEQMGGMGITASQLTSFLAVRAQPGMQQRELASVLGWDEATIGLMVRKLEAQGLFERRSSSRSRRGMEIYLTEEGHKFYRKIKPHVVQVQKTLLETLSPAERKQVLYLLSKMLNVANSHHHAPTGR